MEFILDKRRYADRRGKKEQDYEEDEEEEEKKIDRDIRKFQLSSFPLPYDNNQTLCLGKTFDKREEDLFRSQHPAGAIVSNFNKKMDLVGFTPRRSHESNIDVVGSSSGCGFWPTEREHMFDKVVTPSDVGKLNRLVIPKQYAERFFPLDASSNEKGLLNFEDRNGKPWRFRYSYWNSSQSYVMTKGWSRFVKEKRLDAGDVVSFHRGAGESGKGRFYIDWRHRAAADSSSLSALQRPVSELVGSSRLYPSLPPSPVFLSMPQDHILFGGLPQDHHQFQQLIDSVQTRYHHGHRQDSLLHQKVDYRSRSHDYCVMKSGPSSIEGPTSHQVEGIHVAIDSIPVVQSNTAAPKRLRLFGVNMECPNPSPDEFQTPSPVITSAIVAPYIISSSSSLPPSHLNL